MCVCVCVQRAELATLRDAMERERVRQGCWLGKVWQHMQRGEVGALREEIASERARQGSLHADPEIPDADSR